MPRLSFARNPVLPVTAHAASNTVVSSTLLLTFLSVLTPSQHSTMHLLEVVYTSAVAGLLYVAVSLIRECFVAPTRAIPGHGQLAFQGCGSFTRFAKATFTTRTLRFMKPSETSLGLPLVITRSPTPRRPSMVLARSSPKGIGIKVGSILVRQDRHCFRIKT